MIFGKILQKIKGKIVAKHVTKKVHHTIACMQGVATTGKEDALLIRHDNKEFYYAIPISLVDKKLKEGELLLYSDNAEIKLSTKIELKNNITKLSTELDNLCTQIKQITTAFSSADHVLVAPPTGGPVTGTILLSAIPTLQSAGSNIDTIKANLNGLLGE